MAISKVVLAGVGAAVVAGAVAAGAVVMSGGSDSNSKVSSGPGTSASADVPDPSCQQEPSVKSVVGDTKFNLTFVNNTSQTVQTLWIDYNGKRVFYRQIPAGTAYVQPTFLTHPWVVADLAGQCLTST